MSQPNDPPEDLFYEGDEPEGDLDCPNCGREYDEIDFEYQICSYCKFNNDGRSKQDTVD